MLNVKDIFIIKEELKKKKRSTKGKEKSDYKKDIKIINYMLSELLLNNNIFEIYPKYNKIAIDTNNLSYYPDLVDAVGEYTKLYGQEPLSIDEKELKEMPYEIIIEKAKEFFNVIESDFKSIITQILSEIENNMIISKYNDSMTTWFFNSLKRCIIILNKDSSYNELSGLIHEIGHIIGSTINHHNGSDIISEVESIFFELISADYFANRYPEYKDDIDHYILEIIQELSEKAMRLSILKDAYYSLVEQYASKKMIYKKVKELSIHDYNPTVGNIDTYLTYCISYLIVIELYYEYKNNPQIAYQKLEEIIKLKDDENLIESLKNIDITLNSHSEEFLKELKKHQ